MKEKGGRRREREGTKESYYCTHPLLFGPSAFISPTDTFFVSFSFAHSDTKLPTFLAVLVLMEPVARGRTSMEEAAAAEVDASIG